METLPREEDTIGAYKKTTTLTCKNHQKTTTTNNNNEINFRRLISMAEDFNHYRKQLEAKWQVLFDNLVMGGMEQELESTR